MSSVECNVQDAECKVQHAKYGLQSAKCRRWIPVIVPVLLLTVSREGLSPRPNCLWKEGEGGVVTVTEKFLAIGGSMPPNTLLKQEGLQLASWKTCFFFPFMSIICIYIYIYNIYTYIHTRFLPKQTHVWNGFPKICSTYNWIYISYTHFMCKKKGE